SLDSSFPIASNYEKTVISLAKKLGIDVPGLPTNSQKQDVGRGSDSYYFRQQLSPVKELPEPTNSPTSILKEPNRIEGQGVLPKQLKEDFAKAVDPTVAALLLGQKREALPIEFQQGFLVTVDPTGAELPLNKWLIVPEISRMMDARGMGDHKQTALAYVLGQ